MLTRIAYLIIVLLIGIATIVLCRLVQAPLVESSTSWLTGPLQSAIGYPVAAIRDIAQNVQSIADLRRENQQLQSEIDQLRQETVELPELRLENQRLREQLEYKEANPGLKWVPGKVIGRDPNDAVESIIIDVGTRDGVAEGMTVITPHGLVGQVIRASSNTCKVLLITDFSSSINGRVQSSSRAEGVVNGNPTGQLVMQYIPQGATVRTGDHVITSGLGAVFPSGLLIGTVIDVRQKDVDMFQEARIEPAIDFSRLEEVLVITNHLPTKLE